MQKKNPEGSGWDLVHTWIFGKQPFGGLQSCTEYKVIPCDIRGYFKILVSTATKLMANRFLSIFAP